jgi:signal transduction histidine kinase
MHAEMREFGKAGKYFSEAMSIARELGFVSVVMICYQNLANMYASTGDYKNAYTYHLRYSELHDSLYTVESSQRIAEIQIRYETEKKEQENELLKQESKIQALQINKQQNIRNFLIAFVMLFMGMAIAFYSRYLLKKRTNRLLEEKNRQLGLLNATKDKFFSIIAHDLKNPFGTLLSVSEQLKDRFYELNDEQKMRIIELISHSALLTHNLLENLLEWSVLQTGDIQVRPAKTDLAALVRNTAAILKLNSDRKGLTIETFIPQPTYVIADEEMISTVLRNLLTNAIKFSEKPGIIKVTCVDTGDQAEVSLEDEGIGINQEDLEKLFRLDINHRKIGRSKEKGTGLGLILCKEFIEKNGGKIYAQSTPGKGSIFIFTLPKFKD